MIAAFLRRLRRFVRRPPILQVAALCLRHTATGPEVLLVRSLDSGRWIIPKGWPIAGKTLSEAAATEAWEEAGVRGVPTADPVGSFHYDKRRGSGVVQPCEVQVFALRVESLADSYPESQQRMRRWVPLESAAAKVQEPDLVALIRRHSADLLR